MRRVATCCDYVCISKRCQSYLEWFAKVFWSGPSNSLKQCLNVLNRTYLTYQDSNEKRWLLTLPPGAHGPCWRIWRSSGGESSVAVWCSKAQKNSKKNVQWILMKHSVLVQRLKRSTNIREYLVFQKQPSSTTELYIPAYRNKNVTFSLWVLQKNCVMSRIWRLQQS